MASKAVLVRRQNEAARKEREENQAREDIFDDEDQHLNPEYQREKMRNFWKSVKEKSVGSKSLVSSGAMNSINEEGETGQSHSVQSPDKQKLSSTFGLVDTSLESSKRSISLSVSSDHVMDKHDYILDPQGSWKVMWDLFICVLVIYSLVVIPIGIGFESTPQLPSIVLDYIITAFFVVDIILSFNTAYMDADTELLEFDRSLIATRYLQFWFWVDLVSTIPFDDIVSSIISGSNLSAIRAIRILRLVRLAKLYRLANIDETLEQYQISPSVVNLIILMIQIFFIAHYFACFWHFLALDNVENPEPPRTWLAVFGFDKVDVYDQYVASFYYIIVTMLTIGYGDISPTNDIERIYGILTMLTGAVIFGALTSKVASVIERRNPEAKALKENMSELKALMIELKYSYELKHRLRVAYEYYLTRKSPYGEVEFFDEMPQPILHRLFKQLFGPYIKSVHLFREYQKVFVVPLLRNLKPMNAIKDEIIYGHNDVCNEIVFITTGAVGMIIASTAVGQVLDFNHALAHAQLELRSQAPKVTAAGSMIGYYTIGNFFGDIEYFLNISSIGTYVATTYTQMLSVDHRAFHQARAESLEEAERFDSDIKTRIQVLKSVLRPLYPIAAAQIHKYEVAAAREKGQNAPPPPVSPRAASAATASAAVEDLKRRNAVRRRRGSTISSRVSEGLNPLNHAQQTVAITAFAHRRELDASRLNLTQNTIDFSKTLPADIVETIREEYKLSPVLEEKRDPGNEIEEYVLDGSLPSILIDGEIVTVDMVNDILRDDACNIRKLSALSTDLNNRLSSQSANDSGILSTDDDAAAEAGDSSVVKARFRAVIRYAADKNGRIAPVIKDINEQHYTDRYLLNPEGTRKLYWDFFIGFLIIYSVVIVPMEIAFNRQAYPGSDIVDLVVNGFFLLDIGASFRTAYKDDFLDAMIVTDREIAITYLKTWFPIDIISSIPFDAIISAAVNSSTNLTFTKLLKIIRLFRLLKMTRLLKLGSYIDTAEEVLGLSPAVFGLLSVLIVVFFLSHWVACVLWGMSTVLSENRWYDHDDLVYSDFTSKELSRQYLLALYWTITIMTTVGYGDITPVNTYDRILNIFILLLAGSTFGYMIANVSDLIQGLNEGDAQKRNKLSAITDFLDEKQCPPGVRDEVMKHFKKKYREDTAFDLDKIWRRLPPRLANGIRLSHHDRKLRMIPICANLANVSVRLYIFELMEAHFYEQRQKIVEQGAESDEMYFLVSGCAVVFYDYDVAMRKAVAEATDAAAAATKVAKALKAARISGKEKKISTVATDESTMRSADEEKDDSYAGGDVAAATTTVSPIATHSATHSATSNAAPTTATSIAVDNDMNVILRGKDEEGLELQSIHENFQSSNRSASGVRFSIDEDTNDNTATTTAAVADADVDSFADSDSVPDAASSASGSPAQRPALSRHQSHSAVRQLYDADFKSLKQVKCQRYGDLIDWESDDDNKGEDEAAADAAALLEARLQSDSAAHFEWTPDCFEHVGLQWIYELQPFSYGPGSDDKIGQFCGHVSLFEESTYKLSVVARTDCIVYVLTKSKIERLVREEPTVGRQLQLSLAESIRFQRKIVMKCLAENDADADVRAKALGFLGDLRHTTAADQPQQKTDTLR